ncbi:MAG: endonuclease/exonuclease/phosphatase family protein [Ruminococcaceae bacterium]|jgi:endonuclease/exonuclease/phosphatase family metal-dependent hydrolase|nr:endonuclease/exonuclease/phosphatase family protein [Oscillospiraceae bacterium]
MSKIRVFSFNIWTDNCQGTGPRRFSSRSKLILDEFLPYEPDLIGFQETQPPQRQWLIDNFTDFEVCGIGRDRDLLGESNVVLYRKSRFDLVFLETFWLSDTPRIPGSRFSTDQSDCPRICTCTTLRERESGKCLRHYNTHLDHVGAFAQAQGISLILNRIASDYAENPLPIVLTGDFNVTPDSLVYKSVVTFGGCGAPLADATADVGGTYHGFKKDWPGSKIDYVFTTLPFDPSKSFAAKNERDGLTFSDHYPVCADLEF